MDDLAMRFAVVATIAGAAAIAAVVSRRGRAWRRRPFEPGGLTPGIHFFSSENCRSCSRARSVLEQSGLSFSEHSYESSPDLLDASGIVRVPAVAWIPTDGQPGWLAEGVPTEQRLRRWVGP